MEQRPQWHDVARLFCVLRASTLSADTRLNRHQELRHRACWLGPDTPPLALVFVSHRWETLEHPDPSGRQLRVVRAFLQLLGQAVEALLVDKEARLRILPSLRLEGALQAEELARRMLDFGPFSRDSAACDAGDAKAEILREHRRRNGDSAGFRAWLLDRIGVWIDYCCMPQRPFADEAEAADFGRALKALGGLLRSSSVLALRVAGDDYPTRGWCASEFFLASQGSFSRALFLELDRFERALEVELPAVPGQGQPNAQALQVMVESYRLDHDAFAQACATWTSYPGAFAAHVPPDRWSSYRSLQGSGFYAPAIDPNPFRRALEFTREAERHLIQLWLSASEPCTVALDHLAIERLSTHELHCAVHADLPYLGFLLLGQTRIAVLQPMLRESLHRYLEGLPVRVTLSPPSDRIRAQVSKIRAVQLFEWLTEDRGAGAEGAALRQALAQKPLSFAFPES